MYIFAEKVVESATYSFMICCVVMLFVATAVYVTVASWFCDIQVTMPGEVSFRPIWRS
jgi:hypothetical protein